MTQPDYSGFVEAQDRLNEVLGEDVTFIAVEPKVWPPGTALDPETGEPFDPIVKPDSGGGEVATVVRCTPIEGAVRGSDETEVSASGLRDVGEPVFSVLIADAPLIEDAIYVDHNQERYRISDVKNDDDRVLVYTEAT